MDEWYFHVWPTKLGGFIALAKREPFITGDVMTEPGDVWFEFGDTTDEALIRLKNSLPEGICFGH